MSQSNAARVLPRPGTRPVARPAAPPRLRVVAPRPGASSTTRLAILSIVLLATGLIALLLLNISIGNGAYELTALQKAQQQATEHQQALAERVDTLRAPQNLADRATALGMVPAPNTAFVRLSDGTVIGTAATAQAPPKPVAKATSVLSGSAAAAAGAQKTTGAKTSGAKAPGAKATPAKTTGAKKTTAAKTTAAKTTAAKKGTGTKPAATTPTTTP